MGSFVKIDILSIRCPCGVPIYHAVSIRCPCGVPVVHAGRVLQLPDGKSVVDMKAWPNARFAR